MMKKIVSLLILIMLGIAQSIAQKEATVYVTAKDSQLLISSKGKLAFKKYAQPSEKEPCVFIDPTHRFQEFIGIGGAITDAAAETFAKLPVAEQSKFIEAYYNRDKGIGYTIARTNINSCDFSSDSYNYVVDNDSLLKSFTIKHDLNFKIPLIKKAFQASNHMLLFASPWSPPAWMKTNKDMLHGGKLLRQYQQSWADYYVKFIKAYKSLGIQVWGLTVQNEPMATQRWESCLYTAEEERDFIKYFLGPTLKINKLKVKLIAWDHNRDLIFQRAAVLLNDPKAARYIWGLGYHWYETWNGGPMQFENVKLVKQSFKDINLIFTEGCKEKYNKDSLSNWSLGERYGYSMINDFNNGTVAWTDWNILLDENGGPNHVGNFCFAPVHADLKNGKLLFTNAYYYIGHFSKFIQRGAKRIAVSSNRSTLMTTAFKNPDGTLVVVVMNNTSKKIGYRIWMNGEACETENLPNSINTYLIK